MSYIKVRELQRKLYRAAKTDGDRRFHSLRDKLYRPDVLAHAWVVVKRNRGTYGVDEQSIEQIEQAGVEAFLEGLACELREGTYRPRAARRVRIPKPGKPGKFRELSIPTVEDRVVQTACRLVIEPIFEAQFLPSSFGFRPKRSAKDASQCDGSTAAAPMSLTPTSPTVSARSIRSGSYRWWSGASQTAMSSR